MHRLMHLCKFSNRTTKGKKGQLTQIRHQIKGIVLATKTVCTCTQLIHMHLCSVMVIALATNIPFELLALANLADHGHTQKELLSSTGKLLHSSCSSRPKET